MCDRAQCNIMVVQSEILPERPCVPPHTGARLVDRIIMVLISVLWTRTYTRQRSQHPSVTGGISNMSLLNWRYWAIATTGTSKICRSHNEALKRQTFNNQGHSLCPSQLKGFTNSVLGDWLFLFWALSSSVQLLHVVPSAFLEKKKRGRNDFIKYQNCLCTKLNEASY